MPPFRLIFPATSANLGPGFDALGLAMNLTLTVEAEPANDFSLTVSGRNADRIAAFGTGAKNLMLETYRELAPSGPALRLTLTNEIPLGMGCGSSAAALLAGVFLANHFGELGLPPAEILNEAARREGHPDNVAACFYGGLTASTMVDGRVTAATCGDGLRWRLLLALSDAGLATAHSRALLPDTYSRIDVIVNLQATTLLMAAFAQNRPELLRLGTRDTLHQPYRAEACPLLPRLLPLAGSHGIYSVTLSGAGPAVLLIADPEVSFAIQSGAIREAGGDLVASVESTATFPIQDRAK